jgi:hypothetical protein
MKKTTKIKVIGGDHLNIQKRTKCHVCGSVIDNIHDGPNYQRLCIGSIQTLPDSKGMAGMLSWCELCRDCGEKVIALIAMAGLE